MGISGYRLKIKIKELAKIASSKRKNMDISKKIIEFEFKALLVIIPLLVITLAWSLSIHWLSNYLFQSLSAPFLAGAL